MRTALKFILLFFIFSVLFLLPHALIPLQVKVENPSQYNSLMLLLLLLTDLLIILYLIKRLDLWGLKLFLAVVIIFWGLHTFMTQIEPQTPAYLTWKEMASLSIAYVAIYFVFGYYVAWQFEEVRIFYSGNAEDIGFVRQMKQTLQTKSFIFLFQLLRGFLWIIIGLPIVLYLKGSKKEKIMACAILYSLPAIQLIIDNPFMPLKVRIAHLLEVASSNGLFGLLIGYTSTRKNA